MRIVFAGTPSVAVPSLALLIEEGFCPELVITRPDAPVGRKRLMQPSDVGAFSLEHSLPLLRTKRIDGGLNAEHPEFDFSDFDLGIVVAYGGLIREPILSAPKYGWINLHFSSLPAYRGAAPVQRAILNGDTTTALSVFRLVAELDAGDILLEVPAAILPYETSDQALERLASMGSEVLLNAVQQIAAGTAIFSPQQGETSFAPKFAREDGFLDWSEASESIFNRYRAVSTEPGAVAEIAGIQLKVHELRTVAAENSSETAGQQSNTEPRTAKDETLAALAPGEVSLVQKKLYIGTGTQALELVRVQPIAKNIMSAPDWWRGHISQHKQNQDGSHD
ncbi:MAG: methionyl-tRNA formyltransferase [Microbacteriaceae bacterium]